MRVVIDSLLSIISLMLAFCISSNLIVFTGEQLSSALTFFVAIVVISRYTKGYAYGIIACILSALAINYFFMKPYQEFNLSVTGYFLAVVSFLVTSLIIALLTIRMKKQAEQNAKLYKEQAEMRIEAEREHTRVNLLRAVSHDLRTPLTSILGASSVILDRQEDITMEETIKFAQNIKTDTQWLITMVENLLSVTRMSEEGKELIKHTEVFEEIISEAVQKVKRRFPDVKIKIIEQTSEILMVPMDQMLVQQVVINLVENAIRHSGDENGPIEISLYSEERDGRIMAMFEIRDFGRGIGFDNIDKLMENVKKNKGVESDATRGTGLGLSVCLSILKVHGGFMEAENADGGGAVFRFGLATEEVLEYEQSEQ